MPKGGTRSFVGGGGARCCSCARAHRRRMGRRHWPAPRAWPRRAANRRADRRRPPAAPLLTAALAPRSRASKASHPAGSRVSEGGGELWAAGHGEWGPGTCLLTQLASVRASAFSHGSAGSSPGASSAAKSCAHSTQRRESVTTAACPPTCAPLRSSTVGTSPAGLCSSSSGCFQYAPAGPSGWASDLRPAA